MNRHAASGQQEHVWSNSACIEVLGLPLAMLQQDRQRVCASSPESLPDWDKVLKDVIVRNPALP